MPGSYHLGGAGMLLCLPQSLRTPIQLGIYTVVLIHSSENTPYVCCVARLYGDIDCDDMLRRFDITPLFPR